MTDLRHSARGEAMKTERYDAGLPCWVGLGTRDAAVTAEFYGALLGWDCPEGPPEYGGFRTCLLKGVPVAGMGPTRGSAPIGWRTYVSVTNIDKTIDKVSAAGGSVLLPRADVASAGRLAVVADKMGAPLGLWQAGDFHGAGIISEPGAYTWSELITDDADESAAFYGAVFGWTMTSPSPHDSLRRAEWQLNGRSIAGVLPRPPAMPAEMRPYWDVYFAVADTDATVTKAAEIGATVLRSPTDVEHGRFAVFADPAGHFFSVIKPANTRAS
jgi:predicted enzyme related to lactoylglutathione lyase